MPDPYTQKLFRSYEDEYKYTLRIIKLVQATSSSHPGLFHKVISIIHTADTSKHQGFVSILPELVKLFHDKDLSHLAEECIKYARFVSDVTENGLIRQPEPEGEESSVEETIPHTMPSQSAKNHHKACAKPCVEAPPQLDVSEDTEHEKQTPVQVESEEVAPLKMVPKNVSSNASKKRKRPSSGVLPQRKSVRQWNRLSAGEENLNAEWALVDGVLVSLA